jgi:hypothetical protein
LTIEDRLRLDRLINRAAGYLRGYPTDAVENIQQRLLTLAKAAEGPVDMGLQLTVGPGIDEIQHLPAARADRVILEATPVPRTELSGKCDHRVLVLSDREVRLYESVAGELYEVRDGTFPLHQGPKGPTGSEASPHLAVPRPLPDRRRGPSRQAGRRALLARADAALHRYVSTRPTPLVIVGLTRQLRQFVYGTVHAGLIVAQIPGNYERTRATELAAVVNRCLAARRAI